MSTSTDGGPHVGPADPDRGARNRPGRPARRAAQRDRRRAVHERERDPGVSLDRRRRQLDEARLDQSRHRPHGRRESAHLGASLGRGRRRRPGVRRLAGLPFPLGLQLERHRHEHGHRSVHVDVADPDPDRSDDERSRPLHPRARGRPCDLRQHAPGWRSRTTTTRSPRATRARATSRSASSPPPTAARHGRRRATSAGPFRLAWLAQTDQGPMVGDYISTSFAGRTACVPGVLDRQAADERRVRPARGRRQTRRHDSAGAQRRSRPAATRSASGGRAPAGRARAFH